MNFRFRAARPSSPAGMKPRSVRRSCRHPCTPCSDFETDRVGARPPKQRNVRFAAKDFLPSPRIRSPARFPFRNRSEGPNQAPSASAAPHPSDCAAEPSDKSPSERLASANAVFGAKQRVAIARFPTVAFPASAEPELPFGSAPGLSKRFFFGKEGGGIFPHRRSPNGFPACTRSDGSIPKGILPLRRSPNAIRFSAPPTEPVRLPAGTECAERSEAGAPRSERSHRPQLRTERSRPRPQQRRRRTSARAPAKLHEKSSLSQDAKLRQSDAGNQPPLRRPPRTKNPRDPPNRPSQESDRPFPTAPRRTAKRNGTPAAYAKSPVRSVRKIQNATVGAVCAPSAAVKRAFRSNPNIPATRLAGKRRIATL